MTYAGQRVILDADSHVMELADFLDDFIDPAQRDRLPRGDGRTRPCSRTRVADGPTIGPGEAAWPRSVC